MTNEGYTWEVKYSGEIDECTSTPTWLTELYESYKPAGKRSLLVLLSAGTALLILRIMSAAQLSVADVLIALALVLTSPLTVYLQYPHSSIHIPAINACISLILSLITSELLYGYVSSSITRYENLMTTMIEF